MKLFYLAKRNPGYTAETFPARWRQHGALAMSLPGWDRNSYYMHADLMRPPPLPGLSDAYDGVAYVFLGDGDILSAPQENRDNGRILLEDELKAFDGPVLPWAMIVTEEALKPGPRGGASAYFLFHDTGAARDVAAAFAGAAGAGRVILNRVDGPACKTPCLDYKAVIEVGAVTAEALKALLSAPATAAWRTADLSLAVSEVVLWDTLAAA
jgi:hypothetical protein